MDLKHRGTYTVIATGRTFPIKEDLKSWGFRWLDGQWVRAEAEQSEMNLFKHNVSSGAWDGVDLDIIEEPEIDRILGEEAP